MITALLDQLQEALETNLPGEPLRRTPTTLDILGWSFKAWNQKSTNTLKGIRGSRKHKTLTMGLQHHNTINPQVAIKRLHSEWAENHKERTLLNAIPAEWYAHKETGLPRKAYTVTHPAGIGILEFLPEGKYRVETQITKVIVGHDKVWEVFAVCFEAQAKLARLL